MGSTIGGHIRLPDGKSEEQPQIPEGVTVEQDGKVLRATVTRSEAPAEDPKTEEPKAEEPKAEEESKDERPEWLPEQFKTPEDLAKAYQELRAKMSREGAPKPEAKVEAPSTEEAERLVKEAGLDLDALNAEYAENGALGEATYEALAAKGISREMVDGYIAGQVAVAQQMMAQAAEAVGGEEQLRSVLSWAQANLSQAEQDAYNAVVDTGNIEAIRLALAGIHGKYLAANGTEPKVDTSKGEPVPGTRGAKPFGSTQEIVEAMKDPRYKKGDPAYHAEIQRRLAVTDIFGM